MRGCTIGVNGPAKRLPQPERTQTPDALEQHDVVLLRPNRGFDLQ